MGRPPMTAEQLMTSLRTRYWQHAGVVDGDGCWAWSGYTRNGYGLLRSGRRQDIYAHRLAWRIHFGEDVPDGLHVCHTCDHPLCTRPEHLFLGTNLDNASDARGKALRMKARCRRGHPKTGANLYERVDSRGYLERHCVICDRVARRKRSSGRS